MLVRRAGWAASVLSRWKAQGTGLRAHPSLCPALVYRADVEAGEQTQKQPLLLWISSPVGGTDSGRGVT